MLIWLFAVVVRLPGAAASSEPGEPVVHPAYHGIQFNLLLGCAKGAYFLEMLEVETQGMVVDVRAFLLYMGA